MRPFRASDSQARETLEEMEKNNPAKWRDEVMRLSKVASGGRQAIVFANAARSFQQVYMSSATRTFTFNFQCRLWCRKHSPKYHCLVLPSTSLFLTCVPKLARASSFSVISL